MIQTISKCRNINQIFLAAFLMVSAAWKYFPAAYIGIFILLLFVRVSSNAQCAHDNKKTHYNQNYKKQHAPNYLLWLFLSYNYPASQPASHCSLAPRHVSHFT